MAQTPLTGGDFWTGTRSKVNANTTELYAAIAANGVLIAANDVLIAANTAASDANAILIAANTVLAEADKVLVNDIRAKLKGDYVVSLPALAIGSTPANVANVAFDYNIGGVRYTKAAVAAGTAPGDDVVPVDTYGAVALDVDSAGTITVAEAADNATGYASAALALAGIPAVEATKARMGTVSVIRATAGAFTFGTTSLADGDTTVVYTDGETHFQAIGAAVA